MFKARYHRSVGLLSLPGPLCCHPPPPPASVAAAFGLGLGRGSRREGRQGVGRCVHLAALDGRGLSRGVVRFVDSIIHDGDIIDLSALVLVH